jgi:hypothetical protein
MEKPRSPQKRPPSPQSEVSKGSFRPKSPKPIEWSASKLPNEVYSSAKDKDRLKLNHPLNGGYAKTTERSKPYVGNSDPFAEPRARRRAERLSDNKFLTGAQEEQARTPEKLKKQNPQEKARTRIGKEEPMSEALLYRNMLRAQRKEAAAERYHKDERERLWRKQEAWNGNHLRDGDMRKAQRKGIWQRANGETWGRRGGKFSISLLLSHLLVFSAFHLLSEALRDCIIEELKMLLCTNALREFRRGMIPWMWQHFCYLLLSKGSFRMIDIKMLRPS